MPTRIGPSLPRPLSSNPTAKREEPAKEASAPAAAAPKLADGFDAPKSARSPLRLGDSANPPLAEGDQGRIHYEVREGQLFVNGASFDDIAQGEIGDCYLLATLSAIAKTNPEIINNAVRENADGTCTVRFYERPFFLASRRPVEITVNPELPTTASGGPVYGHSRDPDERWVGIVEKAYAQWKGGYEKIGGGGLPSSALEALTGKGTQYKLATLYASNSMLHRELEEALAKNKPIVAGSFFLSREPIKDGIPNFHAYAVIGTSKEGDELFVHLRNPWGATEPAGDGVDDGIFKMTVSDFKHRFFAVTVGGMEPEDYPSPEPRESR
ncbi:MAG: hypothetical protein HY901_17135 [Deltaproteobacteria bacterium]|nr:hypothetical protein [Deltaproteobacteria bacterium]